MAPTFDNNSLTKYLENKKFQFAKIFQETSPTLSKKDKHEAYGLMVNID